MGDIEVQGVDNTLRERRLAPALVIKGFVKGDDACNYEIYLREIVNSMPFFLNKLNNGKYEASETESHGEDDCCGDGYSFDFKIAESFSMMHGRSIFSQRYVLFYPGVILTIAPSKTQHSKGYKEIQATMLHHALRQYSTDDLWELSDKNANEMNGIEKDIICFLGNLKMNKNLLLFLPLEFYYESKYSVEEAGNQIAKLLWNDFRASMIFRKQICADKDTYETRACHHCGLNNVYLREIILSAY